MEEIFENLRDEIDKNNLERFQDLLEKYPDINNYESQSGWTPLRYSVLNKRGEMIRILVKLGADVNHVNRYGSSALRVSAIRKYYEISEFLLENGANPNIQDGWERTPLHRAVYYNDISIVEMLLGYGANPEIQNKYGKTPLDLAETDEMRDILLGLPGPKRAKK